MPRPDNQEYRSKLLIEIVCEKLYIDRLTDSLFGKRFYPPYLFVVTGLFVEYGILDLYNYYYISKTSFITEPHTLLVPTVGVFGIVGLRYLNEGYANAIDRLDVSTYQHMIDATTHDKFKGIVSLRIRVISYLVLLLLWHSLIVVNTGYAEFIAVEGLATVLYGQFVSYSLILIPVLTDLLLIYVAIHFALPRRLAQADLNLFFYDPRNLGGFGSIGQLLKRSYYVYTGALLLGFFQAYAPTFLNEYFNTSYSSVGSVVPIAFSVAWLIGILSIGYSMSQMHSIMKHKKETKIQELENEIRATIDNPFDIHPENITNQDRYERTQEVLKEVKSTRTYPTTFAMWSQIFISVLLPQALNMAVSFS